MTFRCRETYSGTATVFTSSQHHHDSYLRLIRRNCPSTLNASTTFLVDLNGTGAGTFAAPIILATGDQPTFIAVGSFDASPGLDLAIVFELLGLGVIAFGALCAWIASRETMPQAWARLIFAADLAWVAGSMLVLAVPASWTTAGIAGIVVVALIVADLAILEYLGLRRLGAAH